MTDSASPHLIASYRQLQMQLQEALAQFTAGQLDTAQTTLGRALEHMAGLPQPATAPTQAVQPMDTAAALVLLQRTLVQLAQEGCVAFAFGGVLLGLVREGRLLPFDKDLDMVVPLRYFERALQILPQLGWQPAWVPVQATNFRCYIDPTTNITLDLFAYDFETIPGRVVGGWWPVGLPREMGRLMHFTPFDVALAQHPSGPHWAISQPESVLAELYGDGWRTPDPGFDSTLESPALVVYNTFTRVWAGLRLLSLWLQGNRPGYARLLRVMARLDPADPAVRALVVASTPC